ncbi:hypothetical protein [Acidomonas methanolica]|uniref:hypothetical protein n=1 Tax=Acidomonas methanolica TaxID=437 RepID=UPI002119FB94|nr:hypothetical protein [Acidomonas methanolica]MCQ9156168.1 hypothetical protein [Acidomonas methanolica]
MKKADRAGPPDHPLDVPTPLASVGGKKENTRGKQRLARCAPPKREDMRVIRDGALGCTVSYVAGDRAGLVDASADFLEGWLHLMGICDVDRRDVYRELDHRLQLAELLLLLNREDEGALTEQGGRRRFWRPATTKLP